MTAWNDFVKKIYHEGHDKDPNYMFKNALKDASKRKSEMGSSASGVKSKKQTKKSKKSKKSRKNRKSMKNRK
uniref:Uncharacterized protein n=1 Tax=viral metagenome TaxID=1070528 RepID=A0A6C0IFP6_9ZZZZ